MMSQYCDGNPYFSMFFSSENDAVFDQNHDPYLSSSCSNYASVDCTLSLGTPSTRLNEDDHDRHRLSFSHGDDKTTSSRRGRDPLLARRCANCNTTSTPLWRNGPRGPKSLCNACGIRFKKEERRANAGNSTAAGGPSAAVGVPADHHYHGNASYYDNHHHASSWAHHQQYHSPAVNGYWFNDDVGDEDSDVTAVSFLSWGLNVADRGGLVHDC